MSECVDWQSGKSLEKTNLYMLENELGADITLIMGDAGERIPAHKFMLASRSMVFYAMFYGHLAETGSDVTIPDIEPDIMRKFLRYLYSGQIDLGPDNVMALMYAAKKYSIQTLNTKCHQYLQTEINSSNVCTIMEQAHVFDEHDLWDQCMMTVFSNSDEVLTSEYQDYKSLCHSCLKRLVEDDRLVSQEEWIYTACKNWAQKQCMLKNLPVTGENMRLLLGDIVNKIRFPLFTEQSLLKVTSSDCFLTTEEISDISSYFSWAHSDFNETKEAPGHILKLFPSKPRTNTQIFKLERFSAIAGGTFDFWLNDNLYDAISFKCSRSITLTGILIFSPFPNGTIHGCLSVFDETNTCVQKADGLEIKSSEAKLMEVKFQKSLRIEENRWYTVRQQMAGAKSYFGTHGQKEIVGKGIVFTFRNSPMDTNNTTVESGQIYGLLYT